VEHILLLKEKFNKKGKGEGVFTDDGFAIGVAYILKLLDQNKEFDSLQWFDSIMKKYLSQEKEVENKKGSQDIKTAQLTIKKFKGFRKEFELLHKHTKRFFDLIKNSGKKKFRHQEENKTKAQ